MSKIAQDTTKAGLGCRCGACLGPWWCLARFCSSADRQRECALAHISLYRRIWPYVALSKKLRFVEISAQPALEDLLLGYPQSRQRRGEPHGAARVELLVRAPSRLGQGGRTGHGVRARSLRWAWPRWRPETSPGSGWRHPAVTKPTNNRALGHSERLSERSEHACGVAAAGGRNENKTRGLRVGWECETTEKLMF